MPTELAIKGFVVRATMVVAVEFYKASIAPDHYVVTADDGENTPLTIAGASTILELGPLRVRTAYTFNVTAVYPGDPDIVGASTVETFDPVVSRAMILRQKLADVIRLAALPGIRVLSDTYGRPRFAVNQDSITQPNTLLEISHPKLLTSRLPGSGERSEENWQLDMELFEFTDNEDLGSDKCSIAFDRIRKAVNQTKNLRLLGVSNGTHQWSSEGPAPALEDHYVSQPARLVILVEAVAGKLPYEA